MVCASTVLKSAACQLRNGMSRGSGMGVHSPVYLQLEGRKDTPLPQPHIRGCIQALHLVEEGKRVVAGGFSGISEGKKRCKNHLLKKRALVCPIHHLPLRKTGKTRMMQPKIVLHSTERSRLHPILTGGTERRAIWKRRAAFPRAY